MPFPVSGHLSPWMCTTGGPVAVTSLFLFECLSHILVCYLVYLPSPARSMSESLPNNPNCPPSPYLPPSFAPSMSPSPPYKFLPCCLSPRPSVLAPELVPFVNLLQRLVGHSSGGVQAERYGHPFERPIHVSSLPLAVVEELAVSYLRHALYGGQWAPSRQRQWTWTEIHAFNAKVDWAAWLRNRLLLARFNATVTAPVLCADSEIFERQVGRSASARW